MPLKKGHLKCSGTLELAILEARRTQTPTEILYLFRVCLPYVRSETIPQAR